MIFPSDMRPIDKYRLSLRLSGVDSRDYRSSALLGAARVAAMNRDIDLLYPVVNGRRLSDLTALSRGLVPQNLVNMVRSHWSAAPTVSVDNSSLSDEDIAKQARLSSLGLESTERARLATSLIDSTLAQRAAASAAAAAASVENKSE